MPTDYRVDLDGLQRLIDATATLESRIEGTVGEIDARIRQLHVTWIGEAATTHRQAHDARLAAAREMQDALNALRQKLVTARTAYHQVGPVNVDMWPK
ncbi:MAG: WXG100 family type VII secretion target [Mycobacterium sp.]|nr:WXG100 family type VII secretion target [Mycobacterium sp.]